MYLIRTWVIVTLFLYQIVDAQAVIYSNGQQVGYSIQPANTECYTSTVKTLAECQALATYAVPGKIFVFGTPAEGTYSGYPIGCYMDYNGGTFQGTKFNTVASGGNPSSLANPVCNLSALQLQQMTVTNTTTEIADLATNTTTEIADLATNTTTEIADLATNTTTNISELEITMLESDKKMIQQLESYIAKVVTEQCSPGKYDPLCWCGQIDITCESSQECVDDQCRERCVHPYVTTDCACGANSKYRYCESGSQCIDHHCAPLCDGKPSTHFLRDECTCIGYSPGESYTCAHPWIWCVGGHCVESCGVGAAKSPGICRCGIDMFDIPVYCSDQMCVHDSNIASCE